MQAKTFVPVGQKSAKGPQGSQQHGAMESNLLANMELGVHDPHQRSTSDQVRVCCCHQNLGGCGAEFQSLWPMHTRNLPDQQHDSIGSILLANMKLGVRNSH